MWQHSFHTLIVNVRSQKAILSKYFFQFWEPKQFMVAPWWPLCYWVLMKPLQKVLLWNISCFLGSLNIERLNDWQTFWLRASHLRRLRVKAAQEQYWFSSAHQKLPFLIFIYFRPKSTNPAHNQSHNFANSLLCTWHWMHKIVPLKKFHLHIRAQGSNGEL